MKQKWEVPCRIENIGQAFGISLFTAGLGSSCLAGNEGPGLIAAGTGLVIYDICTPPVTSRAPSIKESVQSVPDDLVER